MKLTLEQFSKMIPTNKEAALWYNVGSELLEKYQINTVKRIAAFMAQTAHESSDFKVIQENLNYSAAGLLKTFGQYFNATTAKEYARNPEKIANRVYDDAVRKNDLGNTKPGDGWKFRGRGLIQLTGRWNYEKFGNVIGMSAEDAATYCESKKGAFESACWFWAVNNLNALADSDSITALSKRVNGGENGLQDRIEKYNKFKQILAVSDAVVSAPVIAPINRSLQRGSRGETVKSVQYALKIPADGIYGITTEAAVRAWQRNNKYTVTGKLDESQISQLLKGQA